MNVYFYWFSQALMQECSQAEHLLGLYKQNPWVYQINQSFISYDFNFLFAREKNVLKLIILINTVKICHDILNKSY